MTRQIRGKMFETNSSSMHSITVGEYCEDDMMDSKSLRPDPNGVIELSGGEFAWSGGAQHDALTKANYLAVWVKQYSPHRERDRKVLVDIIKKQTGAKRVEFSFTTGWDNQFLSTHAYIDHQSEDVAGELFNYKIKKNGYDPKTFEDIYEKTGMTKEQAIERIRQFLFNPKSILTITNDNI